MVEWSAITLSQVCFIDEKKKRLKKNQMYFLGRLSSQSRAEYANNSFHRNTPMKRGALSGKDMYPKENDSSSLPFFDANGKNKHQTLESVEDLLHTGNVSRYVTIIALFLVMCPPKMTLV
jgi:hypothetical protein